MCVRAFCFFKAVYVCVCVWIRAFVKGRLGLCGCEFLLRLSAWYSRRLDQHSSPQLRKDIAERSAAAVPNSAGPGSVP